MLHRAEISHEKVDIEYALAVGAAHSQACKGLSLSNLVRTLHECYDLCVTNAELCRAARVCHDTQLALDVSHFQQLSTVHSQRAGVIIVAQV